MKEFPESSLTQPLAESDDKFVDGRAFALLNLTPHEVFATAQEGEAAKPEKAAENMKKTCPYRHHILLLEGRKEGRKG